MVNKKERKKKEEQDGDDVLMGENQPNVEKVKEVDKKMKRGSEKSPVVGDNENENKNKYPSKNITQAQLKKATEIIEKCGNCPDIETPTEYYKSLLLSYLDLIIDHFKKEKTSINATKLISYNILSGICHKVSEVLATEKTLLLLYSDDNNDSYLILSDIHGMFDVLIYNLINYQCFPKKKVIFLGDYVDKGPNDAVICLLLFLCKIIWPDRLYLLRGNHELRDINRQKDFPTNCGNLLGDKGTYYLFNFVFERMPLAAIWNNNVYLAHGGISQWITSRKDIVKIRRPLKLNRAFRTRLIISDILWSDPYRKCYSKKDGFNKFFAPSNRGCGYAYSKEGLEAILKLLKVSLIVRGHQTSKEGFVEEYKGICYTIHSKPSFKSRSYGSSCILTPDANGNIVLKPLKFKSSMNKDSMVNALNKLKTYWKNAKSTSFQFQSTCLYCNDKENYINEIACQERILITHPQIALWMTSDKIQSLIEIELGKKIDRNWKTPNNLLARFPLYFEISTWSKPGVSIRANSIIEKKEKDIVCKIFKNFEKNDEKNIIVSDPHLTIDDLPFQTLQPLDVKVIKLGCFSYDESDEDTESIGVLENHEIVYDEGDDLNKKEK